jgi:nitrate/TMAO reductase-like tetraheme cytochrome c subunit
MKGKVKVEKGLVDVHVDSERYAQSVHAGIDCTECHQQFSTNPHQPQENGDISSDIAALANNLSRKAMVDSVAIAACMECHDDIYDVWQQSIHGMNIIDKKQTDGAVCIDCHGSPHYITTLNDASSLVNKKNVIKTCAQCHDKEELAKKYSFGTHILDRYYESFHGKKYILGHQDVPTCVDCHRYHDVKKWDDPKSPVAWENRIETCGQCHEGATKKFVTAITHKPIGKDNPVAYYFEKGLIILLLGTFMFIASHVVLETFSEIRDRFFRKRKGE